MSRISLANCCKRLLGSLDVVTRIFGSLTPAIAYSSSTLPINNNQNPNTGMQSVLERFSSNAIVDANATASCLSSAGMRWLLSKAFLSLALLSSRCFSLSSSAFLYRNSFRSLASRRSIPDSTLVRSSKASICHRSFCYWMAKVVITNSTKSSFFLTSRFLTDNELAQDFHDMKASQCSPTDPELVLEVPKLERSSAEAFFSLFITFDDSQDLAKYKFAKRSLLFRLKIEHEHSSSYCSHAYMLTAIPNGGLFPASSWCSNKTPVPYAIPKICLKLFLAELFLDWWTSTFCRHCI